MTEQTTTPTHATAFADLDPRTLVIETNVRTTADLDEGFVASIREHGVLMPILVQAHDDGTLHVRAGQRRTLAAIAADQPTIPARIITGTSDDTERIIVQIIENDDRAALTDTDRAAAYQQMALLGLSAATIARRLHKPKAHVAAGITVAASRTGLDAVAGGMNLLDAAVLAEFDGDEDATRILLADARVGRPLAHTAQRIRDRRAEKAKTDALTAELTTAGVSVRRAPGYYEPEVKPLTDLRAKGAKHALTVIEHASCPGHVAWIDTTGDEPVAVYGCADYKTNKHLKIAAPIDPAAPTKAPMSEQQRAERRTVIENNKAWRSAETVRRGWLATFAQRKTTPKDGAAFTAHVMIDRYALNKAGEQGHRLAATLLGHDGYDPRTYLTGLAAKASPGRAQHIALVIALAAIEDNTHVGTWRNPYGVTRAYFAALRTWGYDLADVEALCLPSTDEPDDTTND